LALQNIPNKGVTCKIFSAKELRALSGRLCPKFRAYTAKYCKEKGYGRLLGRDGTLVEQTLEMIVQDRGEKICKGQRLRD